MIFKTKGNGQLERKGHNGSQNKLGPNPGVDINYTSLEALFHLSRDEIISNSTRI